jgi:hypothetical protein
MRLSAPRPIPPILLVNILYAMLMEAPAVTPHT